MPGFEMFGAEEKKEVNEVLETGILMRYGFDGARNGMWKSKELEQAICSRFETQYAQLTSSGTGALTTAMVALGVGVGDEVIMPAFTFVASFEAILSVGAVPILVDIDSSLTLDPAAVEAAITPKTKCIMPVHMCGSMADLDALKAICDKHNLILLEDACQSIGGTYKGKPLGSIGHAGTFSFDFVKTITCGEGGVVMTNSKEVYTKADAYTDHGHDHAGVDRGADLHPFLGYNFRISELHAAVGLAQIRKLDQFLTIQKRNNQILKSYMEKVPGIVFRTVPDPAGDSGSFLTWFLPSQQATEKVIEAMKQANILAGNFYWYANNWHYIKKWAHLKNVQSLSALNEPQQKALAALSTKTFEKSDAIMSRAISTAISLTWTEAQLHEKGATFLKVIEKAIS
jgi:8-amino-3,8-dideoxy-alpha-D-manno-octulosonate transaminase